jgi:hypothetical protein
MLARFASASMAHEMIFKHATPPMTIQTTLWDASFGNTRTDGEWEELFLFLRDSLAAYLGLPVQINGFSVDDDIDARQSSVGGSITIPVSTPLELTLVGTLTLAVNHGDNVRVEAELLAFCCGKRMSEHRFAAEVPAETLVLQFKPTAEKIGEWTQRLGLDESGEWEEYMSLDDWNRDG